MRTTLTILLIVFSVSISGQEAYWRFENNTTDDMGNHNLVIKDGATYSTSHYVEGARVGVFGSVYARMLTENTVDLSSGGVTINFWVWNNSSGSTRIIAMQQPLIDSKGWRISYDEPNQRIVVTMHNGTSSGAAYSANNSLTTATGMFVSVRWIDINNENVQIFINGSQSGTDSVGLAGCAINDTISIGNSRIQGGCLYGYLDQFSIYTCALTNAQITELYTNVASQYTVACVQSAYNPIAGRHTRPKNDGAYIKPLKDGLPYYFKLKGIVQPPYVPLAANYAYDSTYVLAYNQKYAIPEDLAAGDYVGYWKKSYGWHSVGAISYSIEDNFGNGIAPAGDAFSINPTTGLIYINDPMEIKGRVSQQDTTIRIVIRTTDAGVGSELDTAIIYVKENSYCRFVDYTAGSGSTYSRGAPGVDLPALTAGYGYFIKRGNSVTGKGYDPPDLGGSAANYTIISAYGQGADPIFDGSGATNDAFEFEAGSTYLRMFNLKFQNYYYTAIRTDASTYHAGFYNLEFYNNHTGRTGGDAANDAGDITFYTAPADTATNIDFELINLLSAMSYDPIVKAIGGNIVSTNIKASPRAGYYAFRYTMCCNSTLRGFELNGNEQYAIHTKYRGCTYEDGIINNGYGFFVIVDPTWSAGNSSNTTINNVQIKNTTFGIRISGDGSVPTRGIHNLLIENCDIDNNGYGIYEYYGIGTGRVYRRNIFRNNTTADIYTRSTSAMPSGDSVYYNLSYNSSGIVTPGGSNMRIFNNTIDGAITLTGSTGSVVRNNLYRTLAGYSIQSNNLDIDLMIPITDYFTNYAAHDFSLKGTAFNAIDSGYDVGLTKDIIGTTVAVPDIGAHEYEP